MKMVNCQSCPTINNAINIDWDTLEGMSPKLETHPVNSFFPQGTGGLRMSYDSLQNRLSRRSASSTG